MLNKQFDFIVSIGEDCACSSYIRKFRLQEASYPFDWLTKASFETRIALITSDFQYFLDIQYFKFLPKLAGITDSRCDYYENTQIDMYFYHDFLQGTPLEKSFPTVKKKYQRRIERFYKKIHEANSVLFIWWSRDKVIATEVLENAQQQLAKKFPNQQVHLLVFENDYAKQQVDYQPLSNHLLKVVANFALYDTSKPELETLANIEQTSKVFSQIKIKRSFSYLIMFPFYKSALSLCKLLPSKKLRKSLKAKLKKKLYLG